MSQIEAMAALVLIVFLSGMRHGFEPDHIAVIDSMTRHARENYKLSRWIGFLFSFGHGMIIVLITIFIGIEAVKWDIPFWFSGLGTWISILSLFCLGILNLYTVLKTSRENSVHIHSPKSLVLGKILRLDKVTPSVAWPIVLGMLYSLSFDTLSQTIAFSFNAYTLAGHLFPILLGMIFMMGMMITDGLNGYLVAHVIKRADIKSRWISNMIGLIVGSFSIAISIYYLIIYFYPQAI